MIYPLKTVIFRRLLYVYQAGYSLNPGFFPGRGRIPRLQPLRRESAQILELFRDLAERCTQKGNPKPLIKGRIDRKKTGFYHVLSMFYHVLSKNHSKTCFFFEFPNFPLVHFPIKSCLWCSKINNVVISMLPVVLCRAGLETLLGNYSYISQMHALQLSFDENAPTNNVNFCIPGAYLNCAFANKYFTMSKRPVFWWNLSVQRPSVGLKTLFMAAYGPDPQNPYIFFTGFHGLITFFFWVNMG